MAMSERLAFILSLDANSAISGFRKIGDTAERELGKADDRLQRIGGRMQSAGAGAVAFAGVAGAALMGFARASEDAEAQARILDQGLANNASAAAVGRDAFIDLADSLQNTTKAEGDAVVGLQGMLATLGRTGDEILQLTPLIVDLAQQYGLGFEAAGRLVNNAVEGNTTRLERLIGPMQDAESVAGALTRTVGGFAEREGKSFSGQLEILKNNLGDVAEGIGGGVVGAFNDLLGPLTSAVSKFKELDPATQSAIGKFLAYGTAATGVIGASSYAAGTLAKLRERFVQVDAATGVSTGKLNAFGKAALAISVATALAGLYEMSKAMNALTVDIEEFSTHSNAALDDFVNGAGLQALQHMGQSSEDLARVLVEQSVPATERFAEALERNGQSAEGVRQIIEQKRTTDAQAAIDQEAYTASVDEAAEAMGELNPIIGDVNAQLEANRQRNDEAREAQEQRTASLLASFDAEIGYREALRQTNEKLTEYAAAVNEGSLSVDELGALQDEAASSALDFASAALEASGAAEGSAEGNRVLVQALQAVADKLDPDSALRTQLEGYIAQLNRIPSRISTTIEQTYLPARPNLNAPSQVLGGTKSGKGGGDPVKPGEIIKPTGFKPGQAGKPHGDLVTVLPSEEPLIPTGPTGLPVVNYFPTAGTAAPASRNNTPVTRADNDDTNDLLKQILERLPEKPFDADISERQHDELIFSLVATMQRLTAPTQPAKPGIVGTDGRKQMALDRARA